MQDLKLGPLVIQLCDSELIRRGGDGNWRRVWKWWRLSWWRRVV